MTIRLEQRGGAALLISLLVMLVLDCVVLGTLHLALLERRLADNAAVMLRLRLAAEGGARAGLGAWSPALDSMTLAEPERPILESTTEDGLVVLVSSRRVSQAAWAISSVARQPDPLAGRSAAMLLVLPPAIAPHLDPAAAAISATRVQLMPGATVAAEPAGECGTSDDAILVPDDGSVNVDDAAALDGAASTLTTTTDLLATIDRLLGAAVSVHDGDAEITGEFAGALLVSGNLTIRDGARVQGFVVVHGNVLIEQGAHLAGALHVTGSASVAGDVHLSACRALDAIHAAGLQLARALPERAWLPAF